MSTKNHKRLSPAMVLVLAAAAVGALVVYPTWATSDAQVEIEATGFSGDPISLTIKDADLGNVMETFSKLTNLKIVVDDEAKGRRVTVSVEQVPWDKALADIIKGSGLCSHLASEQGVLYVASVDTIEALRERLATRPHGLAGTMVKDLRLTGTMQAGGRSLAMVTVADPFEESYIIKPGQVLHDGEVTRVLPDRMIVTRADGTEVALEVEAE
jgi:type II secretory pathway component HofQ